MSLLELTAVELAKEIKAGKTTAVEAMKAVLEQIETILPYLILAGLIGAVIWMIPASGSSLADVCLDTILFVVGFLSLSGIFGLKAFKEFSTILRTFLRIK